MISKRTLWLAIIVSMIVGGLAGFAVDRFYLDHSEGHFGKQRFIDFMTEELNLSANQQRQLDSIVTCVHPKFQAIRKDFNTRLNEQADSTERMIKSILSAEQKKKFVVLVQKMRHNR